MRTTIRLAVTLAVLLAGSACARKHITPAFGTANREAFLAQRVRPPDEPAPKPNMALDTQETGVISEGYLRSLAGKSGKAEQPESVLYVAPQQGSAAPQRLAPSVPKE
jgi:hypothetical protein